MPRILERRSAAEKFHALHVSGMRGLMPRPRQTIDGHGWTRRQWLYKRLRGGPVRTGLQVRAEAVVEAKAVSEAAADTSAAAAAAAAEARATAIALQ